MQRRKVVQPPAQHWACISRPVKVMTWTSLAVAVFVPALTVSTVLGAGQHNGEVDKIQASVQYFQNSGQTTTNASGTLFDWGFGRWLDQSLVYVPAYWGTFPLYFVGNPFSFSVTLANTTARGNKTFKIRVLAINNVLNPDGSSGAQIGPAKTWDVTVGPGQTQTVSDTFTIPFDPNLSSGLDTTKIMIYHVNDGTAPQAAFIKQEQAIWCPPSWKNTPPH